MIVRMYWFPYTVPVIVVRFCLNLNFLDNFSINTQMSYFVRTRPVGAELFNVDGHDDTYCSFASTSKTCAFCPHCIYMFFNLMFL